MRLLNYPRHFCLLAVITAALAAAGFRIAALSLVGTFGFYGFLHSVAMALSMTGSGSPRRKLVFVAASVTLSMLNAGAVEFASRFGAIIPGLVKPAVLLSMASGFGATSYSMLIRCCFGVALSPVAVLALAVGCIGSTLAVLASGAYLHGGAIWFAAFWWTAFSLGLWQRDRRAAGSGIL